MIDIRVKKSKKINEDLSAFIKFPYDTELVSIMRNQPSRFWHAATREWEIPAKRLINLIDLFGNQEIKITGDYLITDKKILSELPKEFKFKTTPFDHQLDGVYYGLNHTRFLLGDEQGLGKTKQVIDIAVMNKLTKGYKHCLIICGVNGLKWNWQAEIKTHSNEGSRILGTRYKSNGKAVIGTNKDKLMDLNNLPEDYFLITNIESLRDKEMCKKIKTLCDNKAIEMVAVDEIHKCKNPASQQGKALLTILPETRIAMTGTPLMNTPLDLFIILKWLGFEKHSFYQFKKHYCLMGGYGGYEVMGYKNLGALQERLNDLMLRRLKKGVLNLPDKIYHTEYVEMNKLQLTVYNEVKAEIKEYIDKIKISSNPLAQLIRLRQATGFTGILSNQIKESAKLDRLEEIVEEIAENEEKCIIFSNFTDMTTPAFERLKRFNPAIITGEIKDREDQKDRFMTDDNCKVIIGTIGAMGTGLTLTAASTVIFLDEPWNRANKEQAEDRAHRIGTVGTVNVITLVCHDTIDERINELVHGKGAMADVLVDGKLNRNKQEIIDFLLV